MSIVTKTLGAGGVARRVATLQQIRCQSVVSEFIKKVKQEVDSNAELKKSVEELQQKTQVGWDRTKAATEGLQKVAATSAEAARAAGERAQQRASTLSSAVQEKVAQAAQSFQSTVGGMRGPQATPQAMPQEDDQAGIGPGRPATLEADGTLLGTPAGGAQPRPSQEAPPISGPHAAGAGAGTHAGEQGQSEEQQAPPGGSGDSGREDAHRAGSSSADSWFGAAASWFGRKPVAGTDATPPQALGARLAAAAAAVRREVAAAVLPEADAPSLTRARTAEPAPPPTPSATSALAVATRARPAWRRYWDDMQEKLGLHPVFQRLSALRHSRVVARGKEVAEDLRERWETSDSPFVHRIQDMSDSMFAETERAQALREVRARDPRFDMVAFLRGLRADVPTVVAAFLNGRVPVLREHCTPELVTRLAAIIDAQRASGVASDPTVLDVGEVELVDLKFLEGHPIVVVQFTCQQLNCTRDAFGNVVEGAPDEVQRVYYYWALQQDAAGFAAADGTAYPPRWQLREMMVRGMHNLL